LLFAERSFSPVDFSTKGEAVKYREDHIKGFPDNAMMTPENREYWKKQGKGIKIFKVTETMTLSK